MGSFLTAEQLARDLNLKPATIKRWAQEKIIPCLRLSGKVVRFDPAEVEAALRERASQTGKEGVACAS
jgi:excisionase family DNA binding protein